MKAKRLFDLIFSSLALIVLTPLFVLVALLIKFSSRGPVLYRSKRIGQNRRKIERRSNKLNYENDRRKAERRILDLRGKPFHMLEFRTMADGVDRFGPVVTFNKDHRITKFGFLLRKTKIDKLPSLVNVIKGEMSLVGPRPESPPWVARYPDEAMEVLKVKPGITGPAQIKYRDEENLLDSENVEHKYSQIMQDKLAIDLDYIRKQSFWGDIKIMTRTIMSLFT